MKFEWDITKYELLKENSDPSFMFSMEWKSNDQEKIEFVDELYDGKLSKILKLAEAFKKDPVRRRNKDGRISVSLLRKWIDKYDPEHEFIMYEYDTGQIKLLNINRKIYAINSPARFDKHDELIDEAFHRALVACRAKEKEYFISHDEYQILMFKIINDLNNHDFYCFGNTLMYGSDGLWLRESKESDNKRRLSVEEMQLLIDKNNEIKNLVCRLSERDNIDFEHLVGTKPDSQMFQLLK